HLGMTFLSPALPRAIFAECIPPANILPPWAPQDWSFPMLPAMEERFLRTDLPLFHLTREADPPSLRAVQRNGVMAREKDFSLWNETHDPSGEIRAIYRPLFEKLQAQPRGQIRALDQRLEATMREMGVTFDAARDRPWGRRPWFCDLLPHIFPPEEWT